MFNDRKEKSMKKPVSLVALLILVTLLLPALPALAEQATEGESAMNETPLRILTANIWGDYFGNPVSVRENGFIEGFAAYDPDVIGMQEVTANWHKSKLFEALAERYEIVSDFEGVANNFVPLAYKKDRFDLLESGFHYYTETPDTSKAYTYAVLENKENGQVFAVCNTHFWWKSGAEHDQIRLLNAQELVACMTGLHEKYDCPVFAFGDLNCSAFAGPFLVFSENDVVRLRDVAQSFSKKSSHHGDPKLGDDGLYHGKLPTNPEVKSLDHIIGIRGDYQVSTYQLVLDQGVLDASDHSPVYADIVLKLSE